MTVFRTQPVTVASAFNPHSSAVVIEAFQKGHDGVFQNVPALTVRKTNKGGFPVQGQTLQQIAENLEAVLNAGMPPHQISSGGKAIHFHIVEKEGLVYINDRHPKGGVSVEGIEVRLQPEANEETRRAFFERARAPGVMQAFCAAIVPHPVPGLPSGSKPAARL